MHTKWQIFRYYLKKKTLTGLVVWLPASIVFFTLLNYAMNFGKVPLQHIIVSCTAYSVGIQGGMYIVFTLFWTVVTAVGDRAMQFAKKRLLPYFFLSFTGLSLGIWVANCLLVWFREEPVLENTSVMLETFLTGSLISVAIIFWEAYRYSREEVRELAAKTVEAQYSTLKNQMQPHFLFNSLNSLSQLIDENPNQASAMTEKLATLYRSILTNSKEKTSTVATEIDIARTYLDLETLRFGKRLRYSIGDINGSATLHLPSLMLQTLVENAVKHGISPAVGGGEVNIELTPTTNGMHRVTVRNSGHPFRTNPNSTGTGLENTVKRLELLYGDSHGFTVGPNQQGDTEVSFVFSGARIV